MDLGVEWSCAASSHAAAERLSRELGVSATTAAILVRRGHAEPGAAQAFLAAGERHDPFLIDGMRPACERILAHVERGSRIAVHGDYDVDGVCSAAILIRGLRRLGAEPAWYLPSRGEDGYGLSATTVERLAASGTALLVTTDCGITSVAEIALAQRLGMDAVVTDHHRPGPEIPDCPVVHPALGGYPCPELCAAGVAQKLVEALYGLAGEDPRAAEGDLDLAGLATICDVVPLQGENRRLVREGLRELARTQKPGLRALMRVAGLEPGALDARAAGFRLGPRINAAGRLGRADAALELILTEDEERAAQIADELDLRNRERRDVETRILFAAEAARAEQDAQAAFVLAGEDWHPGVIGIVASRLVERHRRPCVLIAIGEDGGRGSGRSIPAFDLHAGLRACSGLLRQFGGHRAAAGLEIDPGRIPEFRRALAAHAAAALTPRDLVPVERIDAVVPAGTLGLDLAEELERLGPFGQGNPEPALLVPRVRVGDVRAMGDEGQHARFTLSGAGGRARAVGFRTSAASLRALSDGLYDVAVRLEANEWRGTVEPRLILGGIRRAASGPCVVVGEEEPFWAAVERELRADPGRWFPWDEPAAAPEAPGRQLCDRRGEGIAGVVGALLATREPVLVACADSGRRRRALEAAIGGLAEALESAPPALVSWEALARDPALAARFPHLVALDPPPHPSGDRLAAAAPAPECGGFAHLVWGPAEVAFTRASAAAELDLRPALTDVYRTLKSGGRLQGESLESCLRGRAAARRPALCGRLLRVLTELGLAVHEQAGGEHSCELRSAGGRTPLERSATARSCLARLAEVDDHLAGAAAARAA